MTDDDDLYRILARVAEDVDREAPGTFTPREVEMFSEYFERREQAEVDRILSRAGDREVKNMLRIDELEKLRDTDIDQYHRIGGSDELLALLNGDNE